MDDDKSWHLKTMQIQFQLMLLLPLMQFTVCWDMLPILPKTWVDFGFSASTVLFRFFFQVEIKFITHFFCLLLSSQFCIVSFSTLSYTQYTKFQNRVQTVRGFFEQNLAKTISVYVHKSNDLRRLPKVIFLKFFVTAEACNSSDNQKTKTATWRSQQLSAWIFYPNFFSYAKSQVFRSFFLGYVRNILHFVWFMPI